MRVFNEAIELALNDGFKGFRAAAGMSWALDLEDGGAALIAYESLLRTLFSTRGLYDADALSAYPARTIR